MNFKDTSVKVGFVSVITYTILVYYVLLIYFHFFTFKELLTKVDFKSLMNIGVNIEN